jgi:hypothetical protein
MSNQQDRHSDNVTDLPLPVHSSPSPSQPKLGLAKYLPEAKDTASVLKHKPNWVLEKP